MGLYRHGAHVLLRAPAATVAEQVSPATGIIEARDEDICLRRGFTER
jgi:hypothetical protein